MFTYIAYEHIYIAPGSCKSVNLPTISTGTATFCLIIMYKLFDICHECQQHNRLDT